MKWLIALFVLDTILLIRYDYTPVRRLFLWLFAAISCFVAAALVASDNWSEFHLSDWGNAIIALAVAFGVLSTFCLGRELVEAGMLSSQNSKKETGRWVEQSAFAIAPIDVPLSTGGLATCVGLAAIAEPQEKHYLAHVDRAVTPNQLRTSLASFDMRQSRFFLREGLLHSAVSDMVISTLLDSGVPANHIQSVSSKKWCGFLKRSDLPGLLSYRGRCCDGGSGRDSNRVGSALEFRRLKP